MLKNISLEEAKFILLSKIKTTDIERVNLTSSLGRILARDIFAMNNVPNFSRSPLDGYAVIAEDIKFADKNNPTILKVIGEVPAGYVFKGKAEKNTAVKIMTGAPIPDGYNAIIKKEDTDEGVEYVNIYRTSLPYQNVVPVGEDIQKGKKIMEKGTKIHPGCIGILASLGMENVEVYRKPKIGILSTGTELVELGDELKEGQIYNSNLYSIGAIITECGGEPVYLGTVRDDIDTISKSIQSGIQSCDIILSTGGASVGDYDLIGKVYENIGANTLFWRVKMKPGTPVLAAEKEDKILIGLSGNPGAALISFENIVKPLIKKLQGLIDWEPTKIKGIMMDDFNKFSNQRRFLRVRVERLENTYGIYLSGKQNPGVLTSLLTCNALVDVPVNTPFLSKGQEVEAILLKEGGL
ncbi:molybdenum cofactor synthesis domain [Gottschalkia purinilytica]|uniref:Molybdopterin molybdenumtransferase n=1 Tax=Gottschalkia purinilytica TaxID=1503 RepID=A0A0L0WB78_GOTPU|nr:gephyrin-like molybdotransferase Glp [Gottschalkia purinilytica]KNF08758.1 molybdenum cofactor synthesis domain [Gottschalkia purinilytica]